MKAVIFNGMLKEKYIFSRVQIIVKMFRHTVKTYAIICVTCDTPGGESSSLLLGWWAMKTGGGVLGCRINTGRQPRRLPWPNKMSLVSHIFYYYSF